MHSGMSQVALRHQATASGCRFFPKNHAMKTETMYRTIIGAANSIMFGISPVGETTAATIRMTTIAIFQLLTSILAEMVRQAGHHAMPRGGGQQSGRIAHVAGATVLGDHRIVDRRIGLAAGEDRRGGGKGQKTGNGRHCEA